MVPGKMKVIVMEEIETIKRLQIWFKVASNDEDVLIEENVNQFNNNVL